MHIKAIITPSRRACLNVHEDVGFKDGPAVMSEVHAVRRTICAAWRLRLFNLREGRSGLSPRYRGGMNADMPIILAELTGRPRFSRPVIILVVEDEALVSMNVCEFLIEQEFTVFAAQDVEEALGLLEQLDGRIDLIFTDVNMPGAQNGFDLVRQVAARWPAVRMLITSGGYGPGDLPADLERYGPILSKPYRPDDLASRMISAIFPPAEPLDLLATQA